MQADTQAVMRTKLDEAQAELDKHCNVVRDLTMKSREKYAEYIRAQYHDAQAERMARDALDKIDLDISEATVNLDKAQVIFDQAQAEFYKHKPIPKRPISKCDVEELQTVKSERDDLATKLETAEVVKNELKAQLEDVKRERDAIAESFKELRDEIIESYPITASGITASAIQTLTTERDAARTLLKLIYSENPAVFDNIRKELDQVGAE